jgi:multicomponent Na+:H+ antiporter subunit D
MVLPAAAVILAGVGLSLVPGIEHHLEHAAETFQDRPSYVATVLQSHVERTSVDSLSMLKVTASSVAWSLVSVVGSVAFAGLALYRHRLFPERARRRAWELTGGGLRVLRGVHSGVIGDYVAWLTFGVAALGGLLALALR